MLMRKLDFILSKQALVKEDCLFAFIVNLFYRIINVK